MNALIYCKHTIFINQKAVLHAIRPFEQVIDGLF